jgi:hypothetical protein
MQVAAQTTTVMVTAAAAEINTENATLVHSLETREIGQLPLNFRAATTSPLAALAASPDVQQDSSGNFEVGGATTDMVGFSVDGVSTVNVFQSGVSLAVGAAGSNPYPSSEGISELKVTGFDNNAEFSQVPGRMTSATRREMHLRPSRARPAMGLPTKTASTSKATAATSKVHDATGSY